MTNLLELGLDAIERVSTYLTDWRLARRSLGAIDESRFAATGSKGTQSVSYRVLPQLFDDRIQADDVLVDVGCGRGRVLSWWLDRGYRNTMVGLEIDDLIAAETRQRLARYPRISIVTGDAVKNLPNDGTIFFLFNPFDRASLVRFRDKLAGSGLRDRIRVLYYNAVHIEVFREDPAWRVAPIATRMCLDCKVVHEAFLVTPATKAPCGPESPRGA